MPWCVRACCRPATKFKVLSLDQRGRQFLVMMDLAREYGGETARLSEIEALIAQTAKTRYDILVTAVYWRINDHVAVGLPQKGITPTPVPSAAAPQGVVASRCQRPSPAAPCTGGRASIVAAVPCRARCPFPHHAHGAWPYALGHHCARPAAARVQHRSCSFGARQCASAV